MIDLAAARSFLFVPADRPKRIPKALASGADAVIVDLEDAVAPEARDGARSALLAALDPAAPVVVRINGAGTPWHDRDAALGGRPGVAALMLPRAEAPEAVAGLAAPVIPLVETARGMAACEALAGAANAVRLAFGTLDFMLDLGLPEDGPGLDPFRARLALASRVAGIAPPVDGVTPRFDEEAPVEAAARHAALFGMTGKLLIHPRQVAPCHRALRPSEEEVAWARRVLEAAEPGAAGAARLDGTMVDRPVVEHARRLLARA